MQAAVVCASSEGEALLCSPGTCKGATNAGERFAKGAAPVTSNKSTARKHQVEKLIHLKKDVTEHDSLTGRKLSAADFRTTIRSRSRIADLI